MYRLNRTSRFVLITVDEIIAKAAIDQDVDIRIIENSIEVAEERFIAPILGDVFYEDFLNKKNILVTNANKAALLAKVNDSLQYEGKKPIADLKVGSIVNAIEEVQDANLRNLWNRFLWRLTVEAVDMMSTVPSWLRHTKQGQQQNNPNAIGGNGQESASGGRKDIEFKIDRAMMDRINPIRERMHMYICNNKDAYPLYGGECECEEDGVNANLKGGWLLGVYEDEPEVKPEPKPVKQIVTSMLKRYQFVIEPGQTQYPVPGQVDEAVIKDQLTGATLHSFIIEGIELYIGNDPGEMQGLDSNTGILTWNEASQYPVRGILKVYK